MITNFRMDKNPLKKPYDLEKRTLQYSKDVISLVSKAPKSLSNIEIAKQLIRSWDPWELIILNQMNLWERKTL